MALPNFKREPYTAQLLNKKLVNVFVVAPAFLLLATMRLAGQSAYSNAVTSLNPAGYWPMHEVESAAAGDIETNYGSLGPLGQGYYPDWGVGGPVTSIRRGVPGAIVGDTDTAVNFTRGASPAAATYTNFLYVPHMSPLSTLNPPFSVECWFLPTNTASEDIWAQCGDEGLNFGGTSGGNAGFLAGMRLVWENGTNTGFQIFNLDGAQFSAGFAGNTSFPQAYPTNNWYHLVVTCDADTNINLYINGNGVSLANMETGNGPGAYTPDYWTPLTIGGGRGGTRACAGSIDEFAVYTNVIGDIGTHYSDGINGGAGAYFHDVTNDKPVIYLRMDAPAAYSPPAAASWPVLANYGVTNGVAVGNGVYTPGTLPGKVPGPVVNPNGVPFGGVAANLAALSGVGSFGDAGNAAAYNPTGSNANFAVTALFRGYPCDNRNQSIVGHGTNSWQLGINTNGCLVFNAGNGNHAAGGTGPSSGDLKTVGVYNDGRWHQVVAINQTNVVSIYVDGVLDTNGTPAGITPTNMIRGNSSDVIIGSDPIYTNNPAGVGRCFAGQICDVAFFNNALTAVQVQTLYSNCEVAPFIIVQPETGRAINGGSGTSISFGVTADGSQMLTYQWYFNTASNYSGASKLADNAHYAGSATAQLTVTNPVDNDSGYYYVVAANGYGSVTSILAGLTAYAVPKVLSQTPVPYTEPFTLFAGANPIFTVTAAGAQPVSYYWFTNSVLDAAATGSTMVWTNVQVGSITNYCVASNSYGSATSSVWTASVIATPTAPYPSMVLSASPIGYWRLNESTDNGNGNDGVLCHDYAGGNDGFYTNVIIGFSPGYSSTTDPNETCAVFGLFGATPVINEFAGQIQGIDFAATNGANAEFTVECWAEAVNNNQYPQILGAPLAAKGIYNVDDEFNLGIDSTKTHYRFYVRSAAGTVYTVSSGSAPAIDGNWHHVAGVCDEANGLLSLYYDGVLVNSTAIPTKSGLYEAPEPMSFGAGTADGVNYTNQFIGAINDMAVYNYALSASQVGSQYSSGGVPPGFSQPPTNTIVLAPGATLVIPVIAIGSVPLTYQWYDVGGGTNLATGSTNGLPLNATLTVSNVPSVWNNDQLELTVNNAYGSTNFYVTIIVNTNAPQITQNLPSQVSVVSGRSYIYSIGISASTPSPYSYQWYNGGTQLPGATSGTYTATAGNPGSSTYYVVISNAFGVVTSTVSLFTSISVPPAPTSAYATNILRLNPAGYWPMHESEAAPAGDTEFNYGSLGVLGTGYYPDWVSNYGGILRQVPGALDGDSDSAVGFTFGTGNSGTTISFTNGLYVPHASPLTTLNPPFSVECWFYPTNSPTGEAIWAQTGAVGLNDGALGSQVNYNGIMLNWANGTFVPYGYNAENGGITANNGDKLESGGTAGGSPVEAVGKWYHVVVTCDANTNFTLWVNGASVAGPTADVGKYVPDSWTPLSIGSGNGGIRSSSGGVDEFAVYTNVIGDITNHYSDGVSGGPGAYFHDVTNDNPVIYLRMDAPSYTAPSVNTWALLFNYGSAGTNGLYTPGTVPGVMPAPSHANGASFNGLSGSNVTLFSGVSSFADAGDAAAFNPSGSNANFTVTALFRGNPCDNRVQTIAGHGTNSWQLSINTNGRLVFNAGNGNHAAGGTGSAAGDISTIGVYNDGNWHQAVAVNEGNLVSIYVDGVLDTNGTPSGITPTSAIPGNTSDVMIGGDPNYTNNPTGVGRQFAGEICDVAFFTNALSAGQIGALYVVTGTNIPPLFAPLPPAIASASPGGALIVPAGAVGTVPLNYEWQIITNSVTNLLVSGLTNSLPLDATLTVPNVPAAWNGGQLELTVMNSFGTNTAMVTLSIVNTVNTSPTNIVVSVTNNQLFLTWPADHIGWQLQAQTNSRAVGISTNWVNVSGSTSTNQIVVPINLTNGSVFYRLIYP